MSRTSAYSATFAYLFLNARCVSLPSRVVTVAVFSYRNDKATIALYAIFGRSSRPAVASPRDNQFIARYSTSNPHVCRIVRYVDRMSTYATLSYTPARARSGSGACSTGRSACFLRTGSRACISIHERARSIVVTPPPRWTAGLTIHRAIRSFDQTLPPTTVPAGTSETDAGRNV